MNAAPEWRYFRTSKDAAIKLDSAMFSSGDPVYTCSCDNRVGHFGGSRWYLLCFLSKCFTSRTSKLEHELSSNHRHQINQTNHILRNVSDATNPYRWMRFAHTTEGFDAEEGLRDAPSGESSFRRLSAVRTSQRLGVAPCENTRNRSDFFVDSLNAEQRC